MGGCVSSGNSGGGGSSAKTYPSNSVVTPLQRDTDRRIEERLHQDQEDEKKVIKCLLLGAGECGKSTILKQMKILHSNGFKSPEEKASFKALIWKNTLESIQTLCQACETLKIPYEHSLNKNRALALLQLNVNDSPLDYRNDIRTVWRDSGIQKAVQRSSEFHLLDSAPYFLDNTDRILVSTYEPSTQDILRSRIATTGIIETEFTIDKLLFRMYDVGGQRGERKKWIHCFENVTAIMFIASLSEYDQFLAEDRSRNRLKESLDLFEGIINLPWFKDAPIILFLNKDDLFRKKIQSVDIGIYFPQYTGGTEYSLGLKFIQDEYFARNLNETKTIYCFDTDTEVLTNRGFMGVDDIKAALGITTNERQHIYEVPTISTTTTTRKHTSRMTHTSPHPSSPLSVSASSPLLFAAFDPATETFTYQPATHFIEKRSNKMIHLTPEDEMSKWTNDQENAAKEGEEDGNGGDDIHSHQPLSISLRVTPEHTLYVATGEMRPITSIPTSTPTPASTTQTSSLSSLRHPSSSPSADSITSSTRSSPSTPSSSSSASSFHYSFPCPLSKSRQAGSLISSSQSSSASSSPSMECVKFQTYIPGGLNPTMVMEWNHIDLSQMLHLTSESQFLTFLQLYGFWILHSGRMTSDAIVFETTNAMTEDEEEWLQQRLNELSLPFSRTPTSITMIGGEANQQYAIHHLALVNYFRTYYTVGVDPSDCRRVGDSFFPWMYHLSKFHLRHLLGGMMRPSSSYSSSISSSPSPSSPVIATTRSHPYVYHAASESHRLMTSSTKLREELIRIGIHAGYAANYITTTTNTHTHIATPFSSASAPASPSTSTPTPTYIVCLTEQSKMIHPILPLSSTSTSTSPSSLSSNITPSPSSPSSLSRSSPPSSSVASPSPSSRLESVVDERVWCLNVPPTHLIMARRVKRRPKSSNVDDHHNPFNPTPSLSHPAPDTDTDDDILQSSTPVLIGNCHVTDATNTENIAFVWKATKHIILEQNLTKSGLLMC